MTNTDNPGADVLRKEFNRWAEEGRGEAMEAHHLPIVEPTLELMDIQPADRVLDLGCGSGWLARRIAGLAPQGSVMGIDVSDGMIRRAEEASAGVANVRFLAGTAEQIPARAESFNKVLSVESAYYWQDPARGLREVWRILEAGGAAWILINFYRDNPDCHQWQTQFRTPAHLLSAAEWEQFFAAAGFVSITHRFIPDPSPTPEVYAGPWFRDAAQMRRFMDRGALLVTGSKPPRS